MFSLPNHSDLLSLWTLWLYNNITQLPTELPMDNIHNYYSQEIAYVRGHKLKLRWRTVLVFSKECMSSGDFREI